MSGYGWQIAVGVVVLIAVLGIASMVEALGLEPTSAALIFAAILIAPVLFGFLLPIQKFVALYVPAFSDAAGALMPNLEAQPYPQLCAFRTYTRNLWILLVPALLAICMSAAIFAMPADTPPNPSSGSAQQSSADWHPADESPHRWDWIGSLWWLVPVTFWGAAMLVVTWIRERILLMKSVARLGMLTAAKDGDLSYWYYDEDGNRLGGVARHHAGVAILSPITPIFCSRKNSAKHRPGFAFLFHGFVVMDSRHLPAELMRQDRNIVGG